MVTAAIFAALSGAGMLAGALGQEAHKVRQAYRDFQDAAVKSGTGGMDLINKVSMLIQAGVINPDDYPKAMKTLSDLQKAVEKGGYNAEDLYTYFNLPSSNKELIKLMQDVQAHDDFFKWDINNINQLIEQVNSGAPTAGSYNPSAPQMFDTDFEAGPRYDVTPPRLMTAQEMADLYDLNIDPEHYYNLLKQSAEGALKAQDFAAAQAMDASRLMDGEDTATKGMVDYLDAIRGSKAQTISKGLSSGAEAANEVLLNLDKISNRGEGLNTAQGAISQAYESVLRNNADARLNSEMVLNNLLNTLGTGAANFYASDSNLYGQRLLSNADMYAAEQALRGQRLIANESNLGQYANALAGVNANLSSTGNTLLNQYAWILNNAYKANGGDIQRAVQDTMGMFNAGYMNTNKTYTNYLDYYNSLR